MKPTTPTGRHFLVQRNAQDVDAIAGLLDTIKGLEDQVATLQDQVKSLTPEPVTDEGR